MDTLPQSPSTTQPLQTSSSVSSPTQPVTPIGSTAKESEVIRAVSQEAPAITEVGQEMPLAPEVSHVGVSLHPTTVQIPKTVSQLGVKPVGQSVPVPTIPIVTLPLSDEKIAEGLHQSITSSWRWLAQWCVRRLKELHVSLGAKGGKVIRENT
jgi:hypothetical protein